MSDYVLELYAGRTWGKKRLRLAADFEEAIAFLDAVGPLLGKGCVLTLWDAARFAEHEAEEKGPK